MYIQYLNLREIKKRYALHFNQFQKGMPFRNQWEGSGEEFRSYDPLEKVMALFCQRIYLLNDIMLLVKFVWDT